MSEAQTESPPVTNRWVRISIAAPPEGVDVEMTEDGLLWRTKPRKTVQVFQSAADPEADRLRIEAKQEAQFERHVIDVLKARYLAEFDEPAPEAGPEPEPEAPESHFADLMLADETAEDAKVRLTERLKMLRHYLIAPEIKVNEDGSFGLLKHEQEELQDLERRQAQGRWLDA